MNRGTAIVGAVSVAMIGAGIFFWMANSAGSDIGVMPKDVDLTAGQTLYVENCDYCHGASLEGQENWQSPGEDGRLPAPPHDETGHTWHHGDQVLFEYTKLGGRALLAAQGMEFDSAMPGFGDQLSDQEIWNILGYIKSTWSDQIQEMQEVRTEGETRKREN